MMVIAHRHMKGGGAHFEILIEGVLMAPLDSRCTQVGFNLISVQVCKPFQFRPTLLSLYSDLKVKDYENVADIRKALQQLPTSHPQQRQEKLRTSVKRALSDGKTKQRCRGVVGCGVHFFGQFEFGAKPILRRAPLSVLVISSPT